MATKDKILVESLANYAHEAWAGWMKYLFERSTLNPDGSVTIPPEPVERWKYQVDTPYNYLPEEMKPSDRDEAEKMIIIFDEHRRAEEMKKENKSFMELIYSLCMQYAAWYRKQFKVQ